MNPGCAGGFFLEGEFVERIEIMCWGSAQPVREFVRVLPSADAFAQGLAR
jgi:hypothetical protein